MGIIAKKIVDEQLQKNNQGIQVLILYMIENASLIGQNKVEYEDQHCGLE